METNKRTDLLNEEALRNEKISEITSEVEAQELEAIDEFGSIKLIPTPNFAGCNSIGTLLPMNLANDTVRNLSNYARQFDFIEFLKEKLGYSTGLRVCASFDSEQIEALVLAIKSFEKNNAFILGDMAGIGKGRICAGILRYAYQQGLTPVFFSFKPYLFNDIYRDLQDIGFFGFDKNNPKQVAIPKPFILHPDGYITDRDDPDVIVHKPLNYSNTNFVCQDITKKAAKGNYKMSNPRLGYDFNCVFLPYSTVSQARTTIKQEFLEAIAPNSLLVFDESHNAASAQESSNILKRSMPLVEKCKGVLFSSATYAKNPEVFKLYIVKTALRSAVPSLESISAALKVGGENVAEYIATGLVYEGQMIRRERSFGNCKKITEYVGTRREDDGETTRYVQQPGEPTKQRDFYNEAIGYFKELRDFSRSDLARSGVSAAIRRKCALDGKELADDTNYVNMIENWREFREFNPDFKTKAKVIEEAERRFIEQNRGKWAVVGGVKVDSIGRYKSTFRENLFLAIKAKFAADRIIDCLETPVNYTNFDGSTHVAPMKPVVAIKNTSEAIFNELELEEGQIVRNDFSEYLRVVYKKLFKGSFVLRKVTNSFFESKQSLMDRNAWSDSLEMSMSYEVNFEDFADGGVKIAEIQNKLNNYVSDLPFSTIDYLIDRISTKERSRIYYEGNNRAMPPKYGLAGSQYYKVGEVTARKYMLKRIGDSEEFQFVKNDREKSATTNFRAFNSGSVDVLIINVVGSTGGSVQSNPKEGSDTRPRNMITIQFEWDINVEVQKRGRVNRTGQVNAPTYTYIISQIPVELRTYLMFRKKLRKLDANTSADQSISSKQSEVTSVEGGAVEDILNQYGFEAFTENFINLIENESYKALYNSLGTQKRSIFFSAKAEETEYRLERFNEFIRELELYPTSGAENQINQEYFFSKMNRIYAEKIQTLKALGKYQLELESKNYKAKLKQKVVVQLNSGSTIFSKPLFLTDFYTLENKDFLSRDKVEAKIAQFCRDDDGTPVTPAEYQSNLVERFTTEAARMLRQALENYDQKKPKRDDYATDEEFNADMVKFTAGRIAEEKGRKDEFNSTLIYLRYFTPGMSVRYFDAIGKFLGYTIQDAGSQFKYSEGSIVFHFAFLTQIPYVRYRLSANRNLIMQIMEDTKKAKRTYQEDLNRLPIVKQESKEFAQKGIDNYERAERMIQEWRPNPNRRIIRRFLSGNILSGIVYANNYLKGFSTQQFSGLTTVASGEFFRGNEMTDWTLTRFTTVDGGYETAIECQYDREISKDSVIDPEDTNLLISVGSPEIINKIKELPFNELKYYVDLSKVQTSYDINVLMSRQPELVGKDIDDQKVVWNGDENDKGVIPRSVCIYKEEIDGNECVYVEIMNPYRTIKDGAKVFYQSPDRNNALYHDEDILNQYARYKVDSDGSSGRVIWYARQKRNLSSAEIKDLKKIKTDESSDQLINLSAKTPYAIEKIKYKVFIKKFLFNLGNQTDTNNLLSFFEEIHDKYDLNMNFKSSADLYWFVPTQTDIVDISEAKSTETYPEGNYKYAFDKKVDRQIIEAIPNLKTTLTENELPLYGGVVLKFPIRPSLLKSYNLVPLEIPNDIRVKLMFASLSPEDKGVLIRKLEEMKDRDGYDIGEYLQDVVEPKTTDMKYFFGDMRISDYGELVKRYIGDEDLAQFIATEQVSAPVAAAPTKKERVVKSTVELEDAERFLMNLLR